MSRMDLGYGYPPERRGFRVPGFVLFLLFLGLSALYAVGLVHTFMYFTGAITEMGPKTVGRPDRFIVHDWGYFIDLVTWSVFATVTGAGALLITRPISERFTPGGWVDQAWTIVCMVLVMGFGLWRVFVIFAVVLIGFFASAVVYSEGFLALIYLLAAIGLLALPYNLPWLLGVHR